MLYSVGLVSLAFQGGAAFSAVGASKLGPSAVVGRSRVAPVVMESKWDMKEITPDGKLVQRVEGNTRKTWSFNNLAKDRVQVALTSEGRPVNADIQLWLGPDWTPFSLKAYSEDGKLRPIQTLVGTRNKAAMIEVRNVGEYEFPFNAASNYAKGAMALLPQARPNPAYLLPSQSRRLLSQAPEPLFPPTRHASRPFGSCTSPPQPLFQFTPPTPLARSVHAPHLPSPTRLPQEIPATSTPVRVDGGALRSFPLDPECEQLEVVLNTDGKQLNARVELLNAPNNPKQTFEVFTNNGELNSLCVCFNTIDPGNTVRIVNLAPVEFPCYIHLNEL